MRKLIQFLGILILLGTNSNIHAHQSFAAEFSYETFGERQGEVVEIHFVNPHARIFFAVRGDDGNEQIWSAQTFAPQTLLRRSWNKDTIKVGDKVKISGNLGLENSHKIWIVEIELDDGSIIQPNAGAAN